MEQTIKYYQLTLPLANYLKEYTKDVIHSFIHGEHVYAMVDTPELHPLVIYFTGCSIAKDEYWRTYITENQLLHITGTPKIINGKAIVLLKYHSIELIKILQATGTIVLESGGSIGLNADNQIYVTKFSTGFLQVLSGTIEMHYFEHIVELLTNSTPEVINQYDESLRCNHKILNAKYELKI